MNVKQEKGVTEEENKDENEGVRELQEMWRRS